MIRDFLNALFGQSAPIFCFLDFVHLEIVAWLSRDMLTFDLMTLKQDEKEMKKYVIIMNSLNLLDQLRLKNVKGHILSIRKAAFRRPVFDFQLG